MAINGIGSYGMGYYNYQSSINEMRLVQALSKNPKYSQQISSSSSVSGGSLNSSIGFIKEYNSSMSGLMKAASELRSVNTSGVMNKLALTSSDSSVATATERYAVRNKEDITLDVAQLAQAQTNASTGVKGFDRAEGDMNFKIGGLKNEVNVQVSAANADGTAKSNVQMLKDAASQINNSNAGIRAAVVQKDGIASLEVTGKQTGAQNAFYIEGTLGAAAGLDEVRDRAADAEYSVTKGGKTETQTSASNEISLDYGRIGVNLKGTGETTIRAAADSEKIASAVGNLVDAYNSSLKVLNDNYGRGSGVEQQLRSMAAGLGSEKSLQKLGITINKDATMTFDKSVLKETLEKSPDLARDLISGTGGIAEKAYNKAVNGLSTKSGSLINGDLASAESDAMSSPFHMFSMYSRSGAYNMNNYYAVGIMMNYLV